MLNLVRKVLSGAPQYPDIHFDHEEEWDVSNSGEWAHLIQTAQKNKISIEFKRSGLHMSYGKHKEIFRHPSELAKAKKFVKSLI